jgi:gluconolactonase
MGSSGPERVTSPDVTVLATGLRFPEGPIAMADGSVLLVEIEAGNLTRIGTDGAATVVAHLGGGPNGAAIGPDGAAYVCNNGGFQWTETPNGWLLPGHQPEGWGGGRIERVDLATGDVTTLYSLTPTGERLRGPNDLVFDAHGGFWFTDHGKVRERDRDQGGLYYAKVDGSELREVVHPLESPNGVALSPDGATVYVAETHVGRVWSWTIVEPGVIASASPGRKQGATLVTGLPGYQLLDSMAVDAGGMVCVATIAEQAGITVIDPLASSVVERHLMADPLTTNICFGGPDLRTAYVTLSATGQLVSFPWPRAGLGLAHTA